MEIILNFWGWIIKSTQSVRLKLSFDIQKTSQHHHLLSYFIVQSNRSSYNSQSSQISNRCQDELQDLDVADASSSAVKGISHMTQSHPLKILSVHGNCHCDIKTHQKSRNAGELPSRTLFWLRWEKSATRFFKPQQFNWSTFINPE